MQCWTTIPVPYTREDAAWFLANVARRWDAGNVAAFTVEYRGRFAGSIDLRDETGGPRGEDDNAGMWKAGLTHQTLVGVGEGPTLDLVPAKPRS